MAEQLNPGSQKILAQFLADNPGWTPQADKLLAAAQTLCAAHRQDALILICGNGGSAADSLHIAGELAKGFRLKRPLPAAEKRAVAAACGVEGAAPAQPCGGAEAQLADSLQQGLRAVALPGEAALLTAIANDVSFANVYAQQVWALGRKGDVLLALSTSGGAANVLNACRAARARGMTCLGFAGEASSMLDSLCNLVFHAPAQETYRVQEHHLALYHALCAIVENELFGE